jgi:hypothetical protein
MPSASGRLTEPPTSSTNDDPSAVPGNGSGSPRHVMVPWSTPPRRLDQPDDLVDRGRRSVERVDAGVAMVELRRAHERLGDVGEVLELRSAAERDLVR